LKFLALTIPTTAPLIVFDGVCVLCSGFVRWVMRHDRERLFRFTSAQGELGQAIYRDLGLDAVAFETNLLVVDGVAYGKLRAVAEIVSRLGGGWRAARMLRAVPAPVGDWAYDLVATRRYRLFGRRETCWLPTPELADRVI
jgi:predicted DCC family thiol-disulfide oxidoreductase YuxK